MKKFITLFLSATLLLVSCSDDFTEINPVGALSDASLQNATGVDLLLVGAYSMLDGIRQGHGADWHVSADNWWMGEIIHIVSGARSLEPSLFQVACIDTGVIKTVNADQVTKVVRSARSQHQQNACIREK